MCHFPLVKNGGKVKKGKKELNLGQKHILKNIILASGRLIKSEK